MRASDLIKRSTIISVILFVLSVFLTSSSYAKSGEIYSIFEPDRGKDVSENPTWQFESRSGTWEYLTQSGDTLEVVAARFQVGLNDIDLNLNPKIPVDQLLDPGQILYIRRPNLESPLVTRLLPEAAA